MTRKTRFELKTLEKKPLFIHHPLLRRSQRAFFEYLRISPRLESVDVRRTIHGLYDYFHRVSIKKKKKTPKITEIVIAACVNIPSFAGFSCIFLRSLLFLLADTSRRDYRSREIKSGVLKTLRIT